MYFNLFLSYYFFFLLQIIGHQKETVLSENNVLITKQEEVCEIFNDYFVNVAKNIGSSQIKVDDDHPSILAIKDNLPDLDQNSFTFSPIDQDFVEKRIRKVNVKKVTGIDDIVNLSLSSSTFSDRLKEAQVAPIQKKNSVLEKGNYRPVSVLPAISKVFENAIEVQLVQYFDNIFNPFLAALRSGFGCQSTLFRVTEDWKLALDQNKYLAAILMDLSKAFDLSPP
ncbi:unnamed protein product [Mytilus coruscus]|uniref:Reverse transcriptase domain-containing protein n=1 Tax=Mytilus coruscus TaxID=42192 RepID=A0A6J8DLJ5_MYTCO|nr:unnamed protein product [Mytilus coruscus]